MSATRTVKYQNKTFATRKQGLNKTNYCLVNEQGVKGYVDVLHYNEPPLKVGDVIDNAKISSSEYNGKTSYTLNSYDIVDHIPQQNTQYQATQAKVKAAGRQKWSDNEGAIASSGLDKALANLGGCDDDEMLFQEGLRMVRVTERLKQAILNGEHLHTIEETQTTSTSSALSEVSTAQKVLDTTGIDDDIPF